MFIMFIFIFTRFKADMFQMKVHVIHFQSMHWTATQPRPPRVPGRKIPMAPALALPLPSPLMRRLTHPMAPPPPMHRRPNKPSKRARENPARTLPCSLVRPTRSWPRTKPTSPKSKRRTLNSKAIARWSNNTTAVLCWRQYNNKMLP